MILATGDAALAAISNAERLIGWRALGTLDEICAWWLQIPIQPAISKVARPAGQMELALTPFETLSTTSVHFNF